MTKSFKRAQIKQLEDTGEGRAVFATLNVKDKDGDITEPGAFGNQSVLVLPTHNWGSVPLGKGMTREEGDQAIVDFKLNLETQAGRDWHAALKFDLEQGEEPVTEWSYGFSIVDSEQEVRDGEQVRILKRLDVHEVSPVVIGAGEGTGTVAVKQGEGEAKDATPPHSSETSSQPWDGSANERELNSPVPIELARKVYAYVDETRIEDGAVPKSAGKFIHHFISRSGRAQSASIRACVTGIAVLNGARGGTTIPDSERDVIHMEYTVDVSGMDPDDREAIGQLADLYEDCFREVTEKNRDYGFSFLHTGQKLADTDAIPFDDPVRAQVFGLLTRLGDKRERLIENVYGNGDAAVSDPPATTAMEAANYYLFIAFVLGNPELAEEL